MLIQQQDNFPSFCSICDRINTLADVITIYFIVRDDTLIEIFKHHDKSSCTLQYDHSKINSLLNLIINLYVNKITHHVFIRGTECFVVQQ